MSRIYIPIELRRAVLLRARYCCEYCRLHRDDTEFSHQFDHLLAIKHGGATTLDNLALACLLCNRYKGSDVATYDSVTGALVALFHPRQQDWHEHFAIEGVNIIGLTPTGRATIVLLRVNEPARLLDRQTLIAAGRWPLLPE